MISCDSIIFGKDSSGEIILINRDELKGYSRLENADVFKLLFKLDNDDRFGNFSMENSDGYVDIFKNFDISSREWHMLISFLKTGFTPFCQQLDKKAIENVETLNCLCNKLGGIESFDKYYQEFYHQIKNKNTEDEIYNPQCPEEDIRDKYNWIIIDSNHHQNSNNNFISFLNTSYERGEWSAHKTFTHLSYIYVWFRKLKK